MEEVPDEEAGRDHRPLPKGLNAIIMGEKECEEYDTLQKREEIPPKHKKRPNASQDTLNPVKSHPKKKPNALQDTLNPVKSHPTKKPNVSQDTLNPVKSPNASRDTLKRPKESRHVGIDVAECQPTSSKVKVEDLVTDEEEQEMSRRAHRGTSTTGSKRSFWDRPIPKPRFEWTHDPRMPDEWNLMVTAMHEHEEAVRTTKGEQYRDPYPDEISEPEEFTNSWYPDLAQRDHIRKQSTVRLEVEDAHVKSLDELRSRYERPTPAELHA